MFLLHLIGGLGNQMSQVAFAFGVAKANKQPLIIETTSYKNYKRRPCSIQKFSLDNSMTIDNSMNNVFFIKSRLWQKCFHLLTYLTESNRPMNRKYFYWFIKKGHIYSFNSNYYELPKFTKNVDIYGYFLIERYYRDNYDDICRIFQVKDSMIGKIARGYLGLINQEEFPVAISLRLQDDYVKDNRMYVCTPTYFKNGVMLIKEKCPNATYFIFADDMERAKKLDFGIEATYISNISDIEGIHLLKHCRHFIISNSSFSWWGAYLSRYLDKIVVAPDHWMNNHKDYSEKYYENMIKISN